MDPTQFWGLVIGLAAGYGWLMHWFKKELTELKAEIKEENKDLKIEIKSLDNRLVDLDRRLSVIEAMLHFAGIPIAPIRKDNALELKKVEG